MSEHPGVLGHVVPVRVYVTIFATLLALTATTTGMAFVDLGRMNLVIMLAIAVAKATLVVLYFMHLRWSTRLPQLVVGSAISFFGILVLLTMADVLTRS
jgi:cytochrome c oxidase subunit 4